ncbi:hypothetical protein QN277_029149 [Acacia crassicarpa]|uniref:Uncharacterized protein n=1 Tax=Acacia crassicarpa TaxID=499986 RepID=A0AAE1J787_9FABA|nr:hypothetical protein QN277_029149 [Acacia crassicarpa]
MAWSFWRHFPLEVFGCVLEGNSYLSGYSIFGPAIFVSIFMSNLNFLLLSAFM